MDWRQSSFFGGVVSTEAVRWSPRPASEYSTRVYEYSSFRLRKPCFSSNNQNLLKRGFRVHSWWGEGALACAPLKWLVLSSARDACPACSLPPADCSAFSAGGRWPLPWPCPCVWRVPLGWEHGRGQRCADGWRFVLCAHGGAEHAWRRGYFAPGSAVFQQRPCWPHLWRLPGVCVWVCAFFLWGSSSGSCQGASRSRWPAGARGWPACTPAMCKLCACMGACVHGCMRAASGALRGFTWCPLSLLASLDFFVGCTHSSLLSWASSPRTLGSTTASGADLGPWPRP